MRKTLFLLLALLTAATAWAETQTVSYIDADGIEHSVTATVLTGGITTISTEGWYVVNSDITYTSWLSLNANVNLILADGCTMNLGTSDNRLENGGIIDTGTATLTIYGQTLGTGTLSIYTTNSISQGIDVDALTINGGHVIADTNGNYSSGLSTRTGDVTINGGTVNVTVTGSGYEGIYAGHNFNFTGGKLTVDAAQEKAIASNGQYNFSWRNFDDQITIGSTGIYTLNNNNYHANFSRSFTDGTNIYSGTLTGSEINVLKGKTLTPYYADDFAETGTNEYTILTATGWDVFCDMLKGGESFSGKTVKLGADISVSRMAGKTGSSDSTPFGGTFDGCGHTLTFNYTGSEDFIAPFSWTTWTNSPVFRNLTINGTINTTGAYAAGLVGHLYGTVTVEHCTSNVDITCASGGSGFVGLCEHTVNFSDCLSSAVIHSKGGNNSGFVGWSRASGYAINFTGCVFNGKLLQIDGEGGINGGFIGWTGSNKTVTITDCLVNTAALADGETMASGSTATFARGWNATTTATNSYYTTALGAPQCTQARSVTAGENVTTLENAGTPSTVYNVSGITAYPTGIKYNDVLYAGDGDNVSLTLGHSDIEDYAFNGYEASAGTLSGNANPYTLIMPDEDVTIGANYAATFVTYLDMDGNEQRCNDFITLTGTENSIGWTNGEEKWYVANGILNYDHALNIFGDVHIILMDGAVMNLGTEDSNLSGSGIKANGHSISIYGQSTGENMGQLNVYAKWCIDIMNGNITICGGKVLATGHEGFGLYADHGNITITGGEMTASGDYKRGIFAYYGNVTISGGKVTASGNYYGISSSYGSVNITGGQVTATGNDEGIYAPDGDITLGWTNDSDFIYANSYYNQNYENITIADGKAFIDEDNNIYSGSVPCVNYRYPINGKTLRPYSPALRGDVNGDGDVDINDVTALIDYLLGVDVADFNPDGADVDQDDEININDVTALIDHLLGLW